MYSRITQIPQIFSLYWRLLNDSDIFLPGLVGTLELLKNASIIHWVKSVRIWSFSGPHFPVFSPNAGK